MCMCVHMTKRRKNAKNERKNSVPDTRIDPEWKHSTRYNGDGGTGARKRIQKNKTKWRTRSYIHFLLLAPVLIDENKNQVKDRITDIRKRRFRPSTRTRRHHVKSTSFHPTPPKRSPRCGSECIPHENEHPKHPLFPKSQGPSDLHLGLYQGGEGKWDLSPHPF